MFKNECILLCGGTLPVLGRQTQEDLKFKASLGYISRSYLKKKGREHSF
jgi:hypothetical protein